jgi:aspartyl-tRNA(Asn)/glutamyl-tRNA(Gln) amidotransferase subunit A
MSSGRAELCDLTAVEIAGSVKSRKLSAVEVTEAHLARMEALEPKLHAFCTPTPDLAREVASRIDSDIIARRTSAPWLAFPSPYWPEPADGGNPERER